MAGRAELERLQRENDELREENRQLHEQLRQLRDENRRLASAAEVELNPSPSPRRKESPRAGVARAGTSGARGPSFSFLATLPRSRPHAGREPAHGQDARPAHG